MRSGIYNGFWIDPAKQEVNREIFRISKSKLRGIKARPVYKHKNTTNFKIELEPYKDNERVFGGNWRKQRQNLAVNGYAVFLYDDNNTFSGKWVGPKSDGQINAGDWTMQYFTDVENTFLSYNKFRMFRELGEMLFPKKTTLGSIIQKHNTSSTNSCTVANIQLRLNNSSFNPSLSKITLPLSEYLKTSVRKCDKVLDLGTGVGFYSIFLAREIGCHVKGIDVNDKIITLARSNAVNNGVQDFTMFRTCKKESLFSEIDKSEKFDVIIADLPFTTISKSRRSRKSSYFNCFAGSVNLLQQMILGSQYHVNPAGKLIFCYGDSGYTHLLEPIISVSAWSSLIVIKTIESSDETLYIYQLTLTDRIKDFFRQVETQQQVLTELNKIDGNL